MVDISRKNRQRSPLDRLYLVLNESGQMWLVRFAPMGHDNRRITPIIMPISGMEASPSALASVLAWSMRRPGRENAFRVSVGDTLLPPDYDPNADFDETAELQRRLIEAPNWLDTFSLEQIKLKPEIPKCPSRSKLPARTTV